MKILVGVMYSIENEYEECLDKIAQLEGDFDVFKIERLPNKEAHMLLYENFMKKSEDFDLFIKVDADMVISRNSFFIEVQEFFENHKGLDLLQIAVKDFFTDSLIYGLHVYDSSVKWNLKTEEKVFVDRNSSLKNVYHDDKILAPAAFHCPNPSLFQSFHFGLHKGVKYLQWKAEKINYMQSFDHITFIKKTFDNYKIRKDVRLGYAVLGAFYSIRNKLDHSFVDFNNEETVEFFNEVKSMDSKQLDDLIFKFKPLVFKILPFWIACELHFDITNRLIPMKFIISILIMKAFRKAKLILADDQQFISNNKYI